MPDISEIRAGGAYVEIGTRDSDLVAGLNRAATKLRQFGSAIRGIGLQIGAAGGAIFAPLLASAKIFADQGSKLELLHQKTGASVESLSTLGDAAQKSGVDLETLGGALTKMGKTLTNAAQGGKEGAAALELVGLSIADLSSLTPDERFKKIAEGLSKIQDPSIRAGAAMKIFGKSGAELLPLLVRGSVGIEAMQKKARELGLQWSGEDAKAAKEFGDALKDLEEVGLRLADTIGSAVAPVLKVVAQYLTSAAVAAHKWVDDHREVFQTAAIVGGALLVAGAAIVALGTAFTIAGIALGTFASVMGIVVTAIGAILSPAGLALGTIVGLGYALFKFTKYGQQAAQYFSEIWKSISSDAITAFGAIKNALSAGDWALAAQILWTTLQLEWAKGIGELKLAWNSIKAPILSVWNAVVYGILEAWEIGKAGIEDGWAHTLGFLTRTFSTFKAFFRTGWEDITNFAAGQLLKLEGLSADDLKSAQKLLEQQHQQNLRDIAGDEKKEKSDANKTETDTVKNNLAQRDSTLAALVGAEASEKAAIIAGNSAEAEKIEAKINELKRQFAALVGRAKGEASLSPRLGPSPDAPDTPDKPSLENVAKAAQGKVIGIFQAQSNLLAHEVFGGGQNDSAAIKDTAKNTRVMVGVLNKILEKNASLRFQGIPTV